MSEVEDGANPRPAGSDDARRRKRKVLVISTVARSPAALREVVGGEVDELRVVVPVIHQSRLQWLANADDEARKRAEEEARTGRT